MRPTYKNIARIVRAHGNKGEVVVEACQGFPFLIENTDTLWVVPPQLSRPRTLSVASIRGVEDTQHTLEPARRIVSFHEASCISDAEALVGTYLLKDASKISSEDLAQNVNTFLSKPVCDTTYGDIGCVVEVLRSSFQDTLVVEGKMGEIMIPVHEEFLDMDTIFSAQLIVHIPSSLLPEGVGDIR